MEPIIKIKYSFSNHAPIVFTLQELECGALFQNIEKYGEITGRQLWTTFSDKNKKDIFVGDKVLADYDKKVRVVEWVEEEATFKARHLPRAQYEEPLYMGDTLFEVVG